MILLRTQKNTWLYDKLKFISGLLFTSLIFVVLWPIFLLIMLAIKLDSPGPVFYLAKAIGKDGRIFNMYKFRSMQMNADSSIHKAYVSKLIKGEIGKDEKPGTP
jgi:lipopolysaccharide/colanic/teichoic acid biosynthesis glycosyltransferase